MRFLSLLTILAVATVCWPGCKEEPQADPVPYRSEYDSRQQAREQLADQEQEQSPDGLTPQTAKPSPLIPSGQGETPAQANPLQPPKQSFGLSDNVVPAFTEVAPPRVEDQSLPEVAPFAPPNPSDPAKQAE